MPIRAPKAHLYDSITLESTKARVTHAGRKSVYEALNLVVGTDQTPIPKKGPDYDFERLAAELKKAKDAHPDKNDVQVASEDQIVFDTLIRTMDTVLTARFPDISLVDTGAAGI